MTGVQTCALPIYDEIKSGMEPVEVGENTSIKDLQKVKVYKKDT